MLSTLFELYLLTFCLFILYRCSVAVHLWYYRCKDTCVGSHSPFMQAGCIVCLYGFITLLSSLHECLLDISRQLACIKLGSRGKYHPMQYCWVHTSRLLGYLVHTCHLPIAIQQIYCSTQTGQHSRLQRSCCPVDLGIATYTCLHESAD